MKKTHITTILMIITAFLFAVCIFTKKSKDNIAPVIKFPNTALEYTERTNTTQLLDGIKATDNKDGDVTSTLRVLFVIPNKENTDVTVEYIAKDKSNNIARASRTYEYSGSNDLIELVEPSSFETQESSVANMTEDQNESLSDNSSEK